MTQCKVCGDETDYDATKLCTNCWEVERRLALYSKSHLGRVTMRKILEGYGETDNVSERNDDDDDS